MSAVVQSNTTTPDVRFDVANPGAASDCTFVILHRQVNDTPGNPDAHGVYVCVRGGRDRAQPDIAYVYQRLASLLQQDPPRTTDRDWYILSGGRLRLVNHGTVPDGIHEWMRTHSHGDAASRPGPSREWEVLEPSRSKMRWDATWKGVAVGVCNVVFLVCDTDPRYDTPASFRVFVYQRQAADDPRLNERDVWRRVAALLAEPPLHST